MKAHLCLLVLLAAVLILFRLPLSSAQAEVSPFQKGHVFAGVGEGLVHHYDGEGNLLEILDTGKGGYTTGCAFDSAGNLYVTNFTAGDVTKFKGPDAPHTNLGVFGSGYSGAPESIVFDAEGNVYVGAVNGDNDIRKFDALGYPLAQFDVDTEDRGSDWIDLATDQNIMFYTSEGKYIWRYDVARDAQIPLFNFSTALPGSVAYALRVLPDGGVLVADTEFVVRLDSEANEVQRYDVAGENTWFSLNLDPDGESFWAGNFGTGKFYKFDVEGGGAPLLTVDTGVGAGRLYGICVFGEITSGLIDTDKDGLPDDWEINGVDTDNDRERDLILSELDEVGDDIPPDPRHKDIYVWVDWLKGDGHDHRPDEEALKLVKEAFAEAPVAHLNPDGQPGINLHIVYGTEVPETLEREILGSFTRTLAGDYTYNSSEFAAIRREFFHESGSQSGRSSVFHYALFGHLLPQATLDCPTRTGNPTGIAPMINQTDVGSDFIVGHQSHDKNDPLAVGGTFMHELGHTLDLGHGGPGIFNDVNYKPNQLSVMNYSFQSGLLYKSGLIGTTRSMLDFSRFGVETIPDLDERSLDERVGLNGGEAIENYGTIYYGGYTDHLNRPKGISVSHLFINGNLNWNGQDEFTLRPEPSVQVNINGDADQDELGVCHERYSTLRTYNEWLALNYEKGNIGTTGALIPEYPSETFIDADNLDLDIDIQSVTDGVVMVEIDAKPGSDPNSILCTNEREVIPVAILTTEEFDALTVDHTTISFEGAGEFHVDRKTGKLQRHEEDVDDDGDFDLVFHFRNGDTGLTCESAEGTLTGETFDGQAIEGADAVNMINPGG